MEFIEINADNIDKIGDILYNIRDKRDIAQADVASIMKKGQGQISSMEHNRKVPGLRNLVDYLSAVGGWKLAIINTESE